MSFISPGNKKQEERRKKQDQRTKSEEKRKNQNVLEILFNNKQYLFIHTVDVNLQAPLVLKSPFSHIIP